MTHLALPSRGTGKSFLARYINDAGCHFNCVCRRVVDGKHVRVFLETKKALKKGDELHYDYMLGMRKKEIPCRTS